MDPSKNHGDEIAEARRALEDAQARNAEMDSLVEEVHQTSLGIRVIVQPNGYVNRFRKILRGA